MTPSQRLFRLGLLGALAASLCLAAACGGDDPVDVIDGPPGCDPATVLPANFRPIPNVSMGMLNVTTNGGVTSGTADATAGGINGAADNPYLYLDLKAGTKVAVNDLDARMSTAWDVSLKRASLRVNGGDSGTGGRKLAVVQAAMLSGVTAAPTTGYTQDDFTDANCALLTLPAGEPLSAFGEWYNYDPNTHVVVTGDPNKTPALVYPVSDTMFPQNIYRVLFQWKKAGLALYQISFDSPVTKVNVYTDGVHATCTQAGTGGA